jgi:hypothetical protein
LRHWFSKAHNGLDSLFGSLDQIVRRAPDAQLAEYDDGRAAERRAAKIG